MHGATFAVMVISAVGKETILGCMAILAALAAGVVVRRRDED